MIWQKWVWGMGYGYKIPANQLGKWKNLWVSREYGLYLVCVRRELTVDETRVDGDGELRMRQRNERRVANDENREHTADRRETDI